jgi:hypothetical protein
MLAGAHRQRRSQGHYDNPAGAEVVGAGPARVITRCVDQAAFAVEVDALTVLRSPGRCTPPFQ